MQEMIDNLEDNEYWNKYYKSLKNYYEFYCPYLQYRNLFKNNISTNDKILINANGYSRLIYDMFEDGYKNIKIIDKCENAIRYLKDRNKTKEENIKFEVIDIFDLKQNNELYNIIIDKGYIDLLISSNNGINKTESILLEFHKLLKNKGKILIITIYPDILLKIIKYSNDLIFKKIYIYNCFIKIPSVNNEEIKKNYIIKIIK